MLNISRRGTLIKNKKIMSKWLANSRFSKSADFFKILRILASPFPILRQFILSNNKKYLEAIADMYLDLEVIADLLVVSVRDNCDSIESIKTEFNFGIFYHNWKVF